MLSVSCTVTGSMTPRLRTAAPDPLRPPRGRSGKPVVRPWADLQLHQPVTETGSPPWAASGGVFQMPGAGEQTPKVSRW